MRDLLNLAIQKNTSGHPFRELPKFPSAVRDLSFTVPLEVKASDINAVFQKTSLKQLKSFRVFDFYPMTADGKKSFTYTVEFYDDEKTFKDEEVNKLQQTLIAELGKKLNAELRK